jgi:hypothetical protein
MNSYEWKYFSALTIPLQKMVRMYYPQNINIMWHVEKDVLYLKIEDWNIEKIYLPVYEENKEPNQYYYIEHDNIQKDEAEIVFCIQIGNWSIFKIMENYIKNTLTYDKKIHYYFSIIESECTVHNVYYLKSIYKYSTIIKSYNKGMDIGLFMTTLHYIRHKKRKYNYLCKIHTKTDNHFREITITNLIGNNEKISKNIQLLKTNQIGMIAGNIILTFEKDKEYLYSNEYHLKALSRNILYEPFEIEKCNFCAGTMFWTRMSILDTFTLENIQYIYKNLNGLSTLDVNWYAFFYKLNVNETEKVREHYELNKHIHSPNNLHYTSVKKEKGLRDCMLEHAIERFFGYLCIKQNLKLINSE